MVWFVHIAVAGICAPSGAEAALGEPPDHWPAYPGRCLDVGPATETLVERARRCVREEPEDPAPLRILRWLGDERDVPVFEAFARGTHVRIAAEGLMAVGGRDPVRRLAQAEDEPPEALVRLLANQPRFEEEALYVEALGHRSRSAAEALGTLGTATAWAAIEASRPEDHRPHDRQRLEGRAILHDWTDAGLDRARMWLDDPTRLVEWIGQVPRDHPLRGELLMAAIADPKALSGALRSLDGTEPEAYALLATALQSPADPVRMAAASLVASHPHRFPFVEEVTSPADPIRAVGYHARMARLGSEASRDWLWAQLADPLVRWRAADELLALEWGSLQEELAAWVLSEDPPRGTASRAQALGHREPPLEIPSLPSPHLDRSRIPPRDADGLRSEARAILDRGDDAGRRWALAVLPWVGDDRDVDRIVAAHPWPRAAHRTLADLGTPAALEALVALKAPPATWGWSRTPEGWQRMLDGAAEARDIGGVVRPEVVLLRSELDMASVTASALRRSTRTIWRPLDLVWMNAATCRARLALGSGWVSKVAPEPVPRPPDPVRAEAAPAGADDPVVLEHFVAWLTVTDDGVLWVGGDGGLFRVDGADRQQLIPYGTYFMAFGRLHLLGNADGLGFVCPTGELVEVPLSMRRMQVLDEDRVAIESSTGEVQVYDPCGQVLDVPAVVLDPPKGRSVAARPAAKRSPEGRWSYDGRDVVEVATGRVAASMSGSSYMASWRPDGGRLAVPRDQEVWLLDPQRAHTWRLEGPRGQRLAWSPDGATLWVAHGSTVDAWDATTGELRTTGLTHRGRARVIYVSPDGRTVVSGSHRSGRVLLWRRGREPLEMATVPLPEPPSDDPWLDDWRNPRAPDSASVSPDGRQVAVLYNGGDVVVYDGHTGALRFRAKADDAELEGAQHPDLEPKKRFVWDHDGPGRVVGHVELTSSGRAVATLGYGPEGSELVRVWGTDGQLRGQVRFDAPVSPVGFDASERWILRAGPGTFALSTTTGRLEHLVDDATWVWLENGRVHWGHKGVDLPPPKKPFVPPVPATLEGGRVVFWERPDAP